jgi:blue copper oxidase
MKTTLGISLWFLCYCAGAQTPLFVPDTLVGPMISLTMHADSVPFFPGTKSHTYGYNQYAYLGPTLIFEQGQNVDITVHNSINDTTTVHWHGIHLPSKYDGGPHTEIMAGDTWNPQFTVMDKASTYWYHPHMHMKTALQAIKGAAGFIIVRDPNEAALALPRKYGVDDYPLVIQCQQFDANNQAMPLGMQDSTILVNGARANYGHTVVGTFPAQMIRLRLLNGSGERSFNFGFTGNKPFYQIASDGGLLNVPFDTTRVRLSPGERAEILVDLSGLEGQIIHLMSYAAELPMGVQGGPTMPMPPGSPPMDSPLNGINFNVLEIQVVNATADPITSVPALLETNVPYAISDATITRTIRFTADSLMVMDGPFYFNDSSFNMERIDFIIPVNSIEIWKLVNETMVAHPFHIHDVQFYLFDRNGSAPNESERGRKDVVFVPTGDSVMFITKFEDFTDTLVPFMYHCHILMHEDAGMMGQFLVVPPDYLGINSAVVLLESLLAYPNPADDVLTIELPKGTEKFDARIVDNTGRVVFRENGLIQDTLAIAHLDAGTYRIIIHIGKSYYQSQFVKK